MVSASLPEPAAALDDVQLVPVDDLAGGAGQAADPVAAGVAPDVGAGQDGDVVRGLGSEGLALGGDGCHALVLQRLADVVSRTGEVDMARQHLEQAIADADVILVEPVVQPDYTKSRDERDGDVGLTPANYKISRELLETILRRERIDPRRWAPKPATA